MASESATIDRSVLLRQWTWIFRVAFWSVLIAIGAWVFGMLVQVAWAFHFGGEDPLKYRRERIDVELQALATLAPRVVEPVAIAAVIGTSIRTTAEQAAAFTSRTLMNIPGKTRELASSDFIRNHPDPGGTFAREMLARAGADWDLLVAGTYEFAIRSAMYTALVPVLLLGFGLGAVDGLVGRAKRKANAGRESSSLYHRAKLGVTWVLITGYLVCLALPEVDRPTALLLPLAAAAALLVRLQAVYYKKYL